MTKFLFWNINRKPLERKIANLAKAYQVDILILAECSSLAEVLKSLNEEATSFHLTESTCKRIAIYSKLSRADLLTETAHEEEKFTVRRLILPNREDILLIAAHLVSKSRRREGHQTSACQNFSRKIRSLEEVVGHARTIVVGDLNLNPFEAGLIHADGLHAVMSRGIAMKRQRKVEQKYHPYFYNPMWSHFGDATDEPAGTYYDGRGGYDTIFWNMFDQVLLRPDLLPVFQPKNLKILSGDGEESFLSKSGLPRQSIADHLPILFKLSI